MTEEQRAAQIAAFTEELRGYVRYGRTERAEQVRDQLRKLGAKVAPRATPARTQKRRGPKS